ncbi:adenylyltransferase/cytidyltransferase family protein [Aurantibacillus circumpalustris]|uniref:adenylyltransferase/cytidyltransferase family protein n=1 Tax=Aurantibacillus circumpalustris TaxID=3036359 RepID=UPI00295B8D5E|nr:adenylyltransferase/cytidyltransferase family protein [Aurantibacillus circumpalustris]
MVIDKIYISERLKKLNFSTSVLKRLEEKHRFYHTTAHVLQVLSLLEKAKILDDDLFLTAVYHDAVYNPPANDNEERSADLFEKEAKVAKLNASKIATIRQYILDTKSHKSSDKKSQQFINADLDILNQPLEKLITFELQIFKEFQFVDYKIYQPKRIEVLKTFNKDGKLDALIEYIKYWKPSVGVFCGSFNPFHKGHYNILQKAERIFDKVIIAFGKNPEKTDRTWDIPKTIKNRQLGEYSGLLTDYISSIDREVVVIRGLRNSTDFDYEQNQYRYMQELMPEINIVNIFCDKEFEHISSSGIRTLEKYDKHQNYLLD